MVNNHNKNNILKNRSTSGLSPIWERFPYFPVYSSWSIIQYFQLFYHGNIATFVALSLPCHCHVGCNNLFVQVSMLAHRGDSSGGPQHQPQYEVRSFYFMWKLKSTSDFNLDWSLDNCSWLGFRRWRGPNGSGLLINSMWSILKPKLLLS